MNKRANQLINEKSPYLLQHAYNPVEWYAWNNETFGLAIKNEKPVFLSIGYSTCHWCHVMERESFEDVEIAELMNKTFINIKVDREERPDIDGIYMSVCQMLTGSGGWPLTIIMTPDKKPFFAGTYFPKYSIAGRIGMKELILKVDELWNNNRQMLLESAENLMSNLVEYIRGEKDSKSHYNEAKEKNEVYIEIYDTIIHQTYNELRSSFDDVNGGFGLAPKFPMFQNITFLLWYRLNILQSSDYIKSEPLSEGNESSDYEDIKSKVKKTRFQRNDKTGDADFALGMAIKTLNKMRCGGIYDQLGFGFHRYSTDQLWLVPHFEKMLYDQAQAIMAYTEAYRAISDNNFKQTAIEIIEYVMRDMTNDEGCFYSAEDADSEGEEGKFYLWDKQEIEDALGGDAELFCGIFNVKNEGNFIDPIHRGKRKNILHLSRLKENKVKEKDLLKSTYKEIADNGDFKKKFEEMQRRLYEVREQRAKPLKDDKILTDWNGLMIKALSNAGRVFNESKYIDYAKRAIDFILSHFNADGKLSHRWRAGEFAIDGMLNDYAFIIDALIELYQSDFNINYLKEAIKLFDVMFELFWDAEAGGFFVTSKFHEELLVRHKEIYDGAIPSGNSIALHLTIKLWKLTGSSKYRVCIENLISNFFDKISEHPSAYTYFVSGLIYWLANSIEIVIAAEKFDNNVKMMIEKINRIYNPFLIIILKTENNSSELKNIAEYTNDMKLVNNLTTFYLCRNFACELPTNDIEDVLNLIRIQAD